MPGKLPPFRFIYQDESGEPGKAGGDFIVGLLKVREREPIWEAVRKVRQEFHFTNEMHFHKMSGLREKVYVRVLEELATVEEHWRFSAILVRRARLDLSRFSGQRHTAYNFFTRLLLQNRARAISEAILYADEKLRLKEDNFFGYLETATNVEAGRCVLKKVESLDSKKDDLMQVADLLIGCVNTLTSAEPGERKLRVAKVAQRLGHVNPTDGWSVWEWTPRS